ncbi:MAG TPA: hypothetical protein VMT58_05695 [Candidatus Binataceae bacterium]|nr:hypothetical protein [Candidatus Binataceae bacterium]
MLNTHKIIGIAAAAIAVAMAFSFRSIPARAYDLQHARAQRDLTPALQKSLQDKLSDVAELYFEAQDANRADGKKYVDLQQRFEYLPNYGPNGQLVVSCKLGGAEYNPVKSGSSKGAATGVLKYLVFTYALEHGKWVEYQKPKWESQSLGVQAGHEMTKHIERGDEAKAAAEKRAAARRAAAAAAAAQKAADKAQ